MDVGTQILSHINLGSDFFSLPLVIYPCLLHKGELRQILGEPRGSRVRINARQQGC